MPKAAFAQEGTSNMSRSVRSVLKSKKGVAALEYSILAGMIVLAIVTALTTTNISGNIGTIFTNLGTALNSAANPGTGGNGGNGGGTNP